MEELITKEKINTIATSTQGVCFDGTHYYVTDTTSTHGKIFKYNQAGTLVTSRSFNSDGSNYHVGDLCVVDDILYVTCSAYPSTPRNGNVKEYNASDLSYRGIEYPIGTNTVGEGIDWDGTNFWTVDNDNTIRKWDTGFTNPQTYTADFLPKNYSSPHGWQGCKFYDGKLYLNAHEGAYPCTVQEFELVGTEFKIKRHYLRPKWCGQGFDIVDGKFIMGLRGYGVVSDGIAIAEKTPYDHRDKTVCYGFDATERTYAGTGYGENTELRVKIPVKENDIVEVKLQGLFRVDAGSLRAYVDVSSVSAVSATPLFMPRTIRTNTTNSEYSSQDQTRHFIANGDGLVTFAMIWKQNSSGIIRADDRSIVCRIVGNGQDL